MATAQLNTQSPQIVVRPQPAVADNTRVATPTPRPLDNVSDSVSSTPRDTAVLSTQANSQTDKPNPFEGISNSSATVSVEKWGEGKNDSLESILRNQGYTLKEIYTKGPDGKNLIQSVAAANDLKNPNLIHPGQELQVPSKENSEAVSTRGLQAGESETAEVRGEGTGIRATASVDEDGRNTTSVSTLNENRNARINTEASIGDGRIDTSISRTEDGGVNAQSTILSRDGSSRTAVDYQTTADSTTVDVRDIDKNKNLSVTADGENVRVTNPGSDEANSAQVDISVSEREQDGLFENWGRNVASFFGYQEQAPVVGNTEGASEVRVERQENGSTSTTALVNGERQQIGWTPGDSDDSWLERAGARVDGFFNWVGDSIRR